MDEKQKFEIAKKKVQDIKDFYVHLMVYVVVNAFLFIINMLTSRSYLWVVWPMLGWGIGVFFNWLSVFGMNGMLGRDWEKKKVEEIMKKMDDKNKIERG